MKLLRLSWSGGCWLTATCALTVFEYINRAEPNFGESSRTVLFAMLAFSLPTSLLTAAVCALIEWARWGSIWVEFVFVILVGYIQWGVAVPYLLGRKRFPLDESKGAKIDRDPWDAAAFPVGQVNTTGRSS